MENKAIDANYHVKRKGRQNFLQRERRPTFLQDTKQMYQIMEE